MTIYDMDSPYLDVSFDKFISKFNMGNSYRHYRIIEVFNDENVQIQNIVEMLRRYNYYRIGYLQTDNYSNLIIGLK